MSTALVGCTGFVGGNLVRQRAFDVAVHSRNAGELRGRSFDHVVFSAARAEKWRANADPDADQVHIAELVELMQTFSTARLTVISTVDVFDAPHGVDELSPAGGAGLHQYGRGRSELESAARATHPRVVVLRLPALYGRGLKKNVVFDLLEGNQVDRVQPESAFQYYGLHRLSDDVDRAWAAGLPVAHLVTPPIRTADLVASVFESPALPPSNAPVVRYDVQTRHAGAFGGQGRYVEDAAAEMAGLRGFVSAAGRPGPASA